MTVRAKGSHWLALACLEEEEEEEQQQQQGEEEEKEEEEEERSLTLSSLPLFSASQNFSH